MCCVPGHAVELPSIEFLAADDVDMTLRDLVTLEQTECRCRERPPPALVGGAGLEIVVREERASVQL